ncbi:SNF2 family DNA or RNA helicase [Aneurinibacillus soli]|uniref:ATP-dependent helicase HepA n=1 Tax=Aneurinibacillus soli TaxID=1500254 RepID=A0A0U4WNJ1_9BACL|nr:DEAD/DEAH box helicase [Aneurinibacillus soli]PYE61953.1 SNF2 family DNA or RNA helicase [Aneurinibacillus soli]BAU29769.1 ATP-dependent helicase HepA [Aneurinibacillus soli]
MILTDTFTISSDWMENNTFFVQAVDQKGRTVDPFTLKSILFSWHKESYYGTFIETVTHDRKEGLLLSPAIALDLFAAPAPLEHTTIEWSEETNELLAIAPILKQAIAKRHIQPDFTKWQAGEFSWKLLTPIENAPVFLDAWLESLLTEAINEHHPLLHTDVRMRAQWEEEDWLMAIGWTQDNTPFRTCLQLEENEDGECWFLHVLLQNRTQPEQLYAVTQAEPSDMPAPPYPEQWQPYHSRIEKDIRKISRILPWIEETSDRTLRQTLNNEEAWLFLTEGSEQLIESGISVFLPAWWEQIKQMKPRLKARVASSVGSSRQSLFGMEQIMEFDWKLAVGDVTLSEAEFSEIIEQKKHLVHIRGKWIQFDATMLAQLQALIKEASTGRGMTFRDVLENHLLPPEEPSSDGLRIDVELNKPLRKMVSQLLQTSTIPVVESPRSLQGELRPYQLEGVSWLLFLRRFGLGACLADDMGLGKTVQFISYLLHVKETESTQAPSLLICPTSVLGNWQKELQHFAPSLNVHIHYGSAREKGDAFVNACKEADLVLTSYNLSHLDEDDLHAISWNTICLDEAQTIKNAHTKQSSAIRKLSGHHCIALTGTPIENRLTELWSIFDFINPGYLGNLSTFTRRFVTPIEKTKDKALIEAVQQLIRPFLLRRVKKDPKIQLDLPDKYETKEFVSLTVEQASLYEGLIQDMFTKIEQASPMERRGLILSTLTRLKQVCNHPALFLKEGKNPDWQERSHKTERLLTLVDEIRQEGDRCLIFTQFVETGHLLQGILEQELQQPVYFLNGSTPKAKRDEMIARFQDETLPADATCGIFILSLKAGGTGLNLTAANHVFHFDRWWNPAVENQATDRTYRIGQTRHVHVHTFVTMGTLEERIDEMLTQKQNLSEQIVGSGESWVTEMSTDELRELFVLRKEWIE